MEQLIREYISDVLLNRTQMPSLQKDTPLLENGFLDSLALLSLLVFLEEKFGVQVDDFEVIPENFNTIDAICSYISSHQKLPTKE